METRNKMFTIVLGVAVVLGLSLGGIGTAKADLLSHYKFDGTTADDGTLGNAGATLEADAVLTGAPAFGSGNSLVLDGTGDYFNTNVDDAYDFMNEGVTFSFWVQLDVDGWNESWETIFAKGEGGAYRFARKGGDQGQLSYGNNWGGAGTGMNLLDTPIGTANDWHHIVISHGANAGILEIVFDGVSKGTWTGKDINRNVADSLKIGSNPQSGNREFGGMIDDFGILDRAIGLDWAKAIRTLALDVTWEYDVGQVNILGDMHAIGGPGAAAAVGTQIWEYRASDPSINTFVQFGSDGSGVHDTGLTLAATLTSVTSKQWNDATTWDDGTVTPAIIHPVIVTSTDKVTVDNSGGPSVGFSLDIDTATAEVEVSPGKALSIGTDVSVTGILDVQGTLNATSVAVAAGADVDISGILTARGPFTATGALPINIGGELSALSYNNDGVTNLGAGGQLVVGAGGGALDTVNTAGNATISNIGAVTVTNFSDTGVDGTFTKGGAGLLDLKSVSFTAANTVVEAHGGELKMYMASNPLDNDVLDLAGGFTIEGVTTFPIVAGLAYGTVSGGENKTDYPAPPSVVAMGPDIAKSNDRNVWGANTTWVYTGQMFLDSTKSYHFIENIDDFAFLKIGGVTVIDDNAWNAITGNDPLITVGADGWVDIEIRLGNVTGGAGRVGDVDPGFQYRDDAPALTGDLAIDNDHTLHTFPEDPGDMSLFKSPVKVIEPIDMTSTAISVTGDSTLKAITHTGAAFGPLSYDTNSDKTLTIEDPGMGTGVSFAGTTLNVARGGIEMNFPTTLGAVGGAGTLVRSGSENLVIDGDSNTLGAGVSVELAGGAGALALTDATGGGSVAFNNDIGVAEDSNLTAGQYLGGAFGSTVNLGGKITIATGKTLNVTTTDGYSLNFNGVIDPGNMNLNGSVAINGGGSVENLTVAAGSSVSVGAAGLGIEDGGTMALDTQSFSIDGTTLGVGQTPDLLSGQQQFTYGGGTLTVGMAGGVAAYVLDPDKQYDVLFISRNTNGTNSDQTDEDRQRERILTLANNNNVNVHFVKDETDPATIVADSLFPGSLALADYEMLYLSNKANDNSALNQWGALPLPFVVAKEDQWNASSYKMTTSAHDTGSQQYLTILEEHAITAGLPLERVRVASSRNFPNADVGQVAAGATHLAAMDDGDIALFVIEAGGKLTDDSTTDYVRIGAFFHDSRPETGGEIREWGLTLFDQTFLYAMGEAPPVVLNMPETDLIITDDAVLNIGDAGTVVMDELLYGGAGSPVYLTIDGDDPAAIAALGDLWDTQHAYVDWVWFDAGAGEKLGDWLGDGGVEGKLKLIPEPATMTLISLGAIVLLRRRRRS